MSETNFLDEYGNILTPLQYSVAYNYTMNSKDIIKCLEQEGWYKVGDKSDHEKYKHPEKSDHVVVPRPRKDMPIGTLCNIFDILPDLKDGDSSCETLMSERKNIQC